MSWLVRDSGPRPYLLRVRLQKSFAYRRAAMGARAQAIATVRLEEPHVRVTEHRFPPEAETGWHRHGHDYVVLPLRTGKVTPGPPDGTSSTAELLVHQPYARRAGVE